MTSSSKGQGSFAETVAAQTRARGSRYAPSVAALDESQERWRAMHQWCADAFPDLTDGDGRPHPGVVAAANLCSYRRSLGQLDGDFRVEVARVFEAKVAAGWWVVEDEA